MKIHEWQDISKKEDFRENYEFCNYAIIANDCDEDCEFNGCDEDCEYEDICFGLALMPPGTKYFYLIPDRG